MKQKHTVRGVAAMGLLSLLAGCGGESDPFAKEINSYIDVQQVFVNGEPRCELQVQTARSGRDENTPLQRFIKMV